MAFDFSRSHVAKNGFREPYLPGNRKRFDGSLEDVQKVHGQLSQVLLCRDVVYLNGFISAGYAAVRVGTTGSTAESFGLILLLRTY